MSVESMRRVPTQARSRRRLEAILDAAAVVFAESGFEAATMEAIAAGAGTSIGSVYQFFPNKLAVFRALADRCLRRVRALFATLVDQGEGEVAPTWSELLDRAVDGFVEFHRTDPGMRAIWLNLQLYGEFAEADRALERELVARTARILARYAPEAKPAQRRLIAMVLVQVVATQVFVAARQDARAARPVIAEIKTMLHRYLEPYTRETRAGGGQESRKP
jgi:AcrR family transcriptional regulator